MFRILTGRLAFYQWDINQKLVVADKTVTEVHFCNRIDDCALVCEVFDQDGLRLVEVPNILLQADRPICVYAYCTDHTKKTEYFKVLPRPKPADYVYTETEVKSWEALEARVDEKLAQMDDLDTCLTEADTQREERVEQMGRDVAAAVDAAEEAAGSAEQATLAAVERTDKAIAEATEKTDKAIAEATEKTDGAIVKTEAAAEAANQAAAFANNVAGAIETNNFANALRGKASGEYVFLDDVSPLAHNMNVSVNSKNLISTNSVTLDGGYKNLILFDGNITGNFVFSYKQDFDSIVYPGATLFQFIVDDNAVNLNVNNTTINISGNLTKILCVNWGKAVGNITNIQLERGTEATEFSPYTNLKGNTKNLIPYPYIDTGKSEFRGLKVEEDSNGAITISGDFPAAETDYFYLFGYYGNTEKILDLPAGNYTLSNGTSNPSLAYWMDYGIYRASSNTVGNPGMMGKESATITLNEGDYLTYIRIAVGGLWETGTSITMHPQLEAGDTATEFVPYTQPVYLHQYGKNLIPYPYTDISKTTIGGLTVKNNNGIVTLSGTATTLADYRLAEKLYLPAGEYFISGCPKNDGATQCRIMVEVMQSNGKPGYYSDYGDGKPFIITEGAYISMITIRIDTTWASGASKTFKPQLERAAAATAYEPYKEVIYPINELGAINKAYSIYPSTAFITDTENIVLDVEYARDINKAFLELQKMILDKGV